MHIQADKNRTRPAAAGAPTTVQRQVAGLPAAPGNSLQLRQLQASQAMLDGSPHAARLNAVQMQAQPNRTGLPDHLKAGIEHLSGMAMDGVRVHYNSAKPAQLQALAYAQGSDIHLAPGQEKHLPHEAWHVVQQKQGRVRPTSKTRNGIAVNDDRGLEAEADVMGGRAVLQKKGLDAVRPKSARSNLSMDVVQRAVALDLEAVPDMNSIIHIRSIDRPSTPNLQDIPGKDDTNAARHIIPFALMKREFQSRFTGKTITALAASFPQVAIDNDYLVNLSEAMWHAFLYEGIQMDLGDNLANYTKPTAAVDISARHPLPNLENYIGANHNTNRNRNYWSGDQAGNLDKDTNATKLLSKAKTNSQKLIALGSEFDPPPFVTSRLELQQMGEEWARLTNSWLTNDPVSRVAHWPGRDVTWSDAFDNIPQHMKIWNKAK